MAWQAESTTDYRDLLNKIVQMATSKHVSAVAVNAGGSSYLANDILTITHAGAAMDCTIEVLTVDGGGAILTAKLRNMGAFSNRLASAVVNAGGTGYAVDDIIEVEGGTETQKAKVIVATLAGSAIDTVTVQDGGGAYSVAPGLTGATTNNDPGSGSGTGGTLDLTMSALIGTTGIAATGGAGSSATFNLTLTDTGWSAERDWNNYSYNSVTDEKEVVLLGTVSGGDAPYVGFRTYTDTEGIDDRWGILLCGMTAFNSGTILSGQANVGPETEPHATDGAHIPLLNSSMDIWFSFTARKLFADIKTAGVSITAYQSMYVGLLNPYSTTTENPYPLFISGSCSVKNKPPDTNDDYVTGLTECIQESTGQTGPIFFLRLSDLSWQEVVHFNGSGEQKVHIIYPVGEPTELISDPYRLVDDGAFTWFDGITIPDGGVATQTMYPTPDTGGDIFPLVPCCLVRASSASSNSADDDVYGELDNIFWLTGTKSGGGTVTPEDTLTIGADRYIIFANGRRTQQYSYFAVKEE